MAVFTAEPRLIEMEWSWEGEDEVLLGGRAMKTLRSLVKLKIGGLTGVVASLVGKSPPDLRYWIITGHVPAFVKFEGAMFLNGPVWGLEITTVEWPKQVVVSPGDWQQLGLTIPAVMSNSAQRCEPFGTDTKTSPRYK